MHTRSFWKNLKRKIFLIGLNIFFINSCGFNLPTQNLSSLENRIAIFKSQLFITITASVEIKTYFHNANSPLILEYKVLSGKQFDESNYCLFFTATDRNKKTQKGLKLIKISPQKNCHNYENSQKEWLLPYVRHITANIKEPSQLIFNGYVKSFKVSRGKKIEWIFPLYNIPFQELSQKKYPLKNKPQRYDSYQDFTYKNGLRILGLNESDI